MTGLLCGEMKQRCELLSALVMARVDTGSFDFVIAPLRGAITSLRMTEHWNNRRKPRSLALLGMTRGISRCGCMGHLGMGRRCMRRRGVRRWRGFLFWSMGEGMW